MVKCLPELVALTICDFYCILIVFYCIFTVFLKNKNFISKIRRSKVTDYAALDK